MIIKFGSSKLENLCLDKEKARKKYGKNIAKKLIMRLNQLQAFENLMQVPHKPPFRRHKLKGEYEGCFAVVIEGGFRLIFKPIIEDNSNDNTDLKKVKKILILEVKDYHD